MTGELERLKDHVGRRETYVHVLGARIESLRLHRRTS
jgi:hypothetical protein